MRYDDGVEVRSIESVMGEREQWLKDLQANIGRPKGFRGVNPSRWKKVECIDLKMTFLSAGAAAKALNEMGYTKVNRLGINAAMCRSRQDGKVARHAGLRFRYIDEKIKPEHDLAQNWVIVGDKRYKGIKEACKALKCKKWDVTNSIRRGYFAKRIKHPIEVLAVRVNPKYNGYSLLVDGKPCSSLTAVSEEFGVDKSKLYQAMSKGYFVTFERTPCRVEPVKAYAVRNKVA